MVLSGKQSNWTSFVSIPDIPDQVREYLNKYVCLIIKFNLITPRLVAVILLARERIHRELCWIC